MNETKTRSRFWSILANLSVIGSAEVPRRWQKRSSASQLRPKRPGRQGKASTPAPASQVASARLQVAEVFVPPTMERSRVASRRGTGISFAQYNARRGAGPPTRGSRQRTAAAAAVAEAAVAEAAAPAPAAPVVPDAATAAAAAAAAGFDMSEAVSVPLDVDLPAAAHSAHSAAMSFQGPAAPLEQVSGPAGVLGIVPAEIASGAPVVPVIWTDSVAPGQARLDSVHEGMTAGKDQLALANEVRSIFDGTYGSMPVAGPDGAALPTSGTPEGDLFAGEGAGGGEVEGVLAAADAPPADDSDDELITALAGRKRKRRRVGKKGGGGRGAEGATAAKLRDDRAAARDPDYVVPGDVEVSVGEEDGDEEAGGDGDGAGKKVKAVELKPLEKKKRPRGKALKVAVEKMDVDAVLGKDLDGYSKNAEYHMRLARVKAAYEKSRKEREDKRAGKPRVYGKKKRSAMLQAVKEAEAKASAPLPPVGAVAAELAAQPGGSTLPAQDAVLPAPLERVDFNPDV